MEFGDLMRLWMICFHGGKDHGILLMTWIQMELHTIIIKCRTCLKSLWAAINQGWPEDTFHWFNGWQLFMMRTSVLWINIMNTLVGSPQMMRDSLQISKRNLHLYQNQKGSSLYHIQQKQMPSVGYMVHSSQFTEGICFCWIWYKELPFWFW